MYAMQLRISVRCATILCVVAVAGCGPQPCPRGTFERGGVCIEAAPPPNPNDVFDNPVLPEPEESTDSDPIIDGIDNPSASDGDDGSADPPPRSAAAGRRATSASAGRGTGGAGSGATPSAAGGSAMSAGQSGASPSG